MLYEVFIRPPKYLKKIPENYGGLVGWMLNSWGGIDIGEMRPQEQKRVNFKASLRIDDRSCLELKAITHVLGHLKAIFAVKGAGGVKFGANSMEISKRWQDETIRSNESRF